MIKRIALRAFRSLVGTLLAVAVTHVQNDPRYIFILPVLHAAGKAAREKFPTWGNVLPF